MFRLVDKKELSLFLAILCLSLAFYSQTASGQYGDYSVRVDIEIITGSRSPDFYVGDTFHYNITLTNIGTQPIDSNFTVNIYNPSRELLGTRPFRCSIPPGHVVILFPAKEKPIVQGKLEYDLFFFDSVGSYKLQIASSQSLLFWRFTETEYIYQSSFTFYFDAMPRWEKMWRSRTENWIQRNEEWIQKNEQWIEESRQISAENKKTAESMFKLTIMMLLATVMNLLLVVWAAPKEKKRPWNLFLYIYLGVLVFLLIMTLLGIPIPFW